MRRVFTVDTRSLKINYCKIGLGYAVNVNYASMEPQ